MRVNNIERVIKARRSKLLGADGQLNMQAINLDNQEDDQQRELMSLISAAPKVGVLVPNSLMQKSLDFLDQIIKDDSKLKTYFALDSAPRDRCNDTLKPINSEQVNKLREADIGSEDGREIIRKLIQDEYAAYAYTYDTGRLNRLLGFVDSLVEA